MISFIVIWGIFCYSGTLYEESRFLKIYDYTAVNSNRRSYDSFEHIPENRHSVYIYRSVLPESRQI